MADSVSKSLSRGRVGAAVLSLVGAVFAGWGIQEADVLAVTDNFDNMLAMGFSTFAGIMAILSKYRETRRLKE